MAAETGKQSSPAPEDASPASKVFGNGDLAGEILDRVDSATTLVGAALVSRICYQRASDPAFLRRFPARHPPRPVGFYVTGRYCSEFVPMPPATELTAGAVFDAFYPNSCAVYDSRINGRVLFKGAEKVDHRYKLLVLNDRLRRAGDGARRELVLPKNSHASGNCVDAMLLLPEDDDAAAVCYRVEADYAGTDDGPSLAVQVFEFKLPRQGEGKWIRRCFKRVVLPRTPERIAPKVVLTGGKRVYMLAEAGYLIRVHVHELGKAEVFTIKLPEGVTCSNQNLSLCGSEDGPALFLIHVMAGKLLTVWLRSTDDSEWVLKDTVSVEEACGHLFVAEQGSDDAAANSSVSVVGVGDNAEFVFLQHRGSGAVVYLHLRSTRAERVYQIPRERDRPRNRDIIQVHPLYTVWPPIFPPLAD